MDVALEHIIRPTTVLPSSGFNPCFRGCRSGTLSVSIPERGRIRVSILVFVDVALEHNFQDRYRNPQMRFQSLFSWMSLWNERVVWSGADADILVSILVFVDVALEPGKNGLPAGQPPDVSILVFVDVALELPVD